MTIPEQVPAIADRHIKIADHQRGMLDPQDHLGGQTVFRRQHPVSIRAEDETEAIADLDRIVHHEHQRRHFFVERWPRRGTDGSIIVSDTHIRSDATLVPLLQKLHLAVWQSLALFELPPGRRNLRDRLPATGK